MWSSAGGPSPAIWLAQAGADARFLLGALCFFKPLSQRQEKMQTCLICDDHALVREALVGSVKMNWPAAVVSEASDFPQAWARARSQPSFCIADLVMPDRKSVG